ncbi:MAG: hypothetical protein GWO20_09765 [Candidatus Korarchaeota archaeon]|nr:hypothetical protein [Candidatus Korarchaeota archaeon]NIU83772.1 hypothetical protein [Candidatus Thorarchaeota archaeon]NIW15357.1 hypothetical protein [Candidatus Thorarchaeota archaeon]NIW52083.1 hypothetical protein [Candidatus Korarchaeota archaeon]
MKRKEKLQIVGVSLVAFMVFAIIFYGLGRMLFSLKYDDPKRIFVDSIIEGVVIASTFTTLITFHLLARVWKEELKELSKEKE